MSDTVSAWAAPTAAWQIEVDAARNIEDVGALMARTRCLIGRLVVENGEQVDPPVRVLIPANRVDLFVGREE